MSVRGVDGRAAAQRLSLASFDAVDQSGKLPDKATILYINVALFDEDTGKWWYPSERDQSVNAMHEMGHALGFAHEQHRPDDQIDINLGGIKQSLAICKDQREGETWTGGTYENTVNGETWVDCSSIMSYEGGYDLSPGDVVGVQRRYGRKPSGSIVGYGGHCVQVRNRQERLISGKCTGDPEVTWRSTTTDHTGLTPLTQLQSDENGFMWQRTSTATSASVRGDNPSSSSLQEFPATDMQWLALGNLCVTAASAKSGARLSVETCGTEPSLERWDFFAPRSGQIRLHGTDLCVRAPNTTAKLGDRLSLSSCLSGVQTASRTSFTFADGTIASGGMCANLLGGIPKPGAEIGLWDGCSFFVNSQFHASGRIKNGAECARWSGGGSQDLGAELLVGTCNAAPKRDSSGYARPDPLAWDIYW